MQKSSHEESGKDQRHGRDNPEVKGETVSGFYILQPPPSLPRLRFSKDIHCMFVERKRKTVFFLPDTRFTAFIATVEKS